MVMETYGDCINAILFAAGVVIEGSGVMVHGTPGIISYNYM